MRQLLLAVALTAALALPVSAFAAPADKREVAAYADKLMATLYPADGPGAALLVARGDEVLYRGARGQASVWC